MPKVDTPHSQHAAMAERWQRCRDAAIGLDAVREQKGTYLPMLSGQDDTEYKAYLKRADFYGALPRSIQGHRGSVFRKPPKIEVPAAIEDWLEDVTLTGIGLEGLLADAFDELLEVGRYGLFVDMGVKKDGQEQRPYLVLTAAENVVSWRTTSQGGAQVLDRVVLREVVEEDDLEDEFILNEVEQYRVLAIAEGVFTHTLYRRAADDKDGDWEIHDVITPDTRGKPFDSIPFWFGNSGDMTPDVDKPPLMEVADLCLSMWRNSADLENGFHYVGIPTPWVAGFPVGTSLRIGSNTAWVSDKTDAKADMLEFSGQGLKGLSEHIDGKKSDCAVFGSRLLEEQKKTAETAETVRLRHAGETASLVSMAAVVDATFTAALEFLTMWAGQSGDVLVELNRDLLAVKATPQELQALTAAVQAGLMSFETYYYNLEQLELTRPAVDAEEESGEIDNDGDKAVVNHFAQGRPADEAEEQKAEGLAEQVVAA